MRSRNCCLKSVPRLSALLFTTPPKKFLNVASPVLGKKLVPVDTNSTRRWHRETQRGYVSGLDLHKYVFKGLLGLLSFIARVVISYETALFAEQVVDSSS